MMPAKGKRKEPEKKVKPETAKRRETKPALKAQPGASDRPCPEPASVVKPSRRLFRRFLAGLSITLACLSLIVSVYALFLERAVLNSEQYTANMQEIIKDPAVKSAVSEYASEELFLALDVQKRIIKVLPEQIKFIAAPATVWLRGFTQQQIYKLLETKQFQDAWAEVNRTAHKTIVATLRGEAENVRMTEEGTVQIDLIPIVKDLALEFTEGTKAHRYVSEIPEDSVGPALRTALGAALDKDLPEDFGTLTVFKPGQLTGVRRAVVILDAAAKWAPWATLGLTLFAFAVSVNRRKTAMHLGGGAAAAAVIGVLATQIAVKQSLLAIADDKARELVAVVVEVMLRGLPDILYYVAAAGLILWAVMFVAGQKTMFMRIDGWIRRRIGYSTPDDLETHSVIRWITRYADGIRMVFVAGALIALALIKGWWGIAAFTVILAAGEAVLRYLTGWDPFFRQRP